MASRNQTAQQRLTAQAKRRFLLAFKTRPFVTTAAAAAKIHRCTVSHWRKIDPDFAEKMDAMREEIIDQVEEAAFQRAVHGVESYVTCKDGLVYMKLLDDNNRPVLHGVGDPIIDQSTGLPAIDAEGNPILSAGHPVMVPVKERKYSDSLAALILKANRGELYGDKQEIKHSGAVSMFGEITDDELDKRIARAEARKAEEALPE